MTRLVGMVTKKLQVPVMSVMSSIFAMVSSNLWIALLLFAEMVTRRKTGLAVRVVLSLIGISTLQKLHFVVVMISVKERKLGNRLKKSEQLRFKGIKQTIVH